MWAHCSFSVPWSDIHSKFRFSTGGFGKLLEEDLYEVWVCDKMDPCAGASLPPRRCDPTQCLQKGVPADCNINKEILEDEPECAGGYTVELGAEFLATDYWGNTNVLHQQYECCALLKHTGESNSNSKIVVVVKVVTGSARDRHKG